VGEAGEDSEVDYEEGHTKEVVEAEEVEKDTGEDNQGGGIQEKIVKVGRIQGKK